LFVLLVGGCINSMTDEYSFLLRYDVGEVEIGDIVDVYEIRLDDEGMKSKRARILSTVVTTTPYGLKYLDTVAEYVEGFKND